jgi:hypothetical protein
MGGLRRFDIVRDPPSLTCLVCAAPMAPHEPIVYLSSGAVVHVRCRRWRGAPPGPMAVATIQPRTRTRSAGAVARATMPRVHQGGNT